jgi:hypothetical protein
MVETPEEPGRQGRDETDLDPEDAPVELDQDGFLVSSGRHRQFPTDLDAWVRWAGAVVVCVAAYETLAALISGSLLGWATGYLLLPPPDGYYSLLLLAGVLLLVLHRGLGSGTDSARWARGAACLAAGTGGALVVAQVAGNIGLIVHPSGNGLGEPAAYTAGAIFGGIGALSEAVLAAFAAVLAVLLYRWSRAAAGPAGEGGRESEPEDVIDESGTSTAPGSGRGGSVGPAVASLLLGALIAGACLVAFAIGTARAQTNSTIPTSGTPVVSVPSPAVAISMLPGSVEECSSSSPAGVTFCMWAPPIVSPAPSPQS